MIKLKPSQDSDFLTAVINGEFTLNANDKIRIKMQKGGTGSAVLEPSSLNVPPVLTQYPALLTFYKL